MKDWDCWWWVSSVRLPGDRLSDQSQSCELASKSSAGRVVPDRAVFRAPCPRMLCSLTKGTHKSHENKKEVGDREDSLLCGKSTVVGRLWAMLTYPTVYGNWRLCDFRVFCRLVNTETISSRQENPETTNLNVDSRWTQPKSWITLLHLLINDKCQTCSGSQLEETSKDFSRVFRQV